MALTKVTGSGIQGITIDSNSRIIMSSQPRWFVGKTGNAQDAINPVVFDAVGVNNGSHYSTSRTILAVDNRDCTYNHWLDNKHCR